MLNYYSILGVNQNANANEIKAAYRRLLKTYHPDINDSSVAVNTTQQIVEAYKVLSNSKLRKEYDFFLQQQTTPSTPPNFNFYQSTKKKTKSNYSNIYNNPIFRAKAKHQRAEREQREKNDNKTLKYAFIVPTVGLLISVTLSLVGIFISKRINIKADSITQLAHHWLTEIPEEIKSSPIISVLDISHNWFEELPGEISNFENLAYLDASHNNISKINPKAFNAELIYSLNLAYNEIEEIPKEIENMKNLRQLNLRNNNLAYLPLESLKKLNIEFIDLRENKFTTQEKTKILNALPDTEIIF